VTAPKKTLKRIEILRGYKSFNKVFEQSKRIKSDTIVAYVQTRLTGSSLQAGFFLSKKK
jgi:RNase P protein component